MIHVCFGLHDKTGGYSKFTGTAILSIFENTTSNVTIHILHDNTLTLDNREKFSYLAGQYNQRVKFYNVEELCADKLEEMVDLIPAVKTSQYTVGAMYRLLTPQVLSADVDKIIYLDSDIIVNLDIHELWRIDLGDKPLAAAPEAVIDRLGLPRNAPNSYLISNGFVGYNDYFNSGVLIMNLKFLRTEKDILLNGIKFIGEHPQCIALDQDILNYLFSKDYVKLPGKFDVFVSHERLARQTEKHPYAAIYHYAAATLGLNMNDPFNRLWMKYFPKTPWFGAETVEHLYERFNQIHVGLKNSMIQISAAMSGKTRAFFTVPENVDALKKIFLVRDDEEIILAENQSSLQKLIDAMKKSRGKKIFFILLPNFPFQALAEAGFVFGKDFFNGFDFLSEAHGLPMNSHRFIKAM